MLPFNFLRQLIPASHVLLIVLATLLLTAPAAFAGTWLNVKTFGAVGDGVTDDQTAIQNAINAAATTPGSTVFFPPGNYLHTGQLTVNGVNLVGKGATITAGADPASIVLGGTGSGLSGLIIDATVSAAPIGVDFNNATQFSMRNTVIAAKFENPLTVSFSSNGVIDGNRVNSPVIPNRIFGLLDSTGVIVSNNMFIGNATARKGIDVLGACSDISITGNQFTDGDTGIRFAQINGNNFNISKNIILRPNNYGIVLENVNTNSILLQKNTITGLNASQGIYVDTTTNCQMIKNVIDQFRIGIQAGNCTNVSMVKNTISRCANQGIRVISGPAAAGAFVINKNGLSDCGLAGATLAVIEVGPDDFTSLAITGNSYKGNATNLAFFIRCLVPIPPTVAFGNKTKTLLPSQFGP